MTRWIGFLRGINVGGKNRLPMKDLKGLMEAAGFRDVETYIQSGNLLFTGPEAEEDVIATQIADGIEAGHGFRPAVKVITPEALQAAAAGNPFGDGEGLDKTLHLFFLAYPPPTPDWEKMDGLKTPSEAYLLNGEIFYLHTPDGFGTSKLAARVEKLLGVPATARNWRTVNAVLRLAEPT